MTYCLNYNSDQIQNIYSCDFDKDQCSGTLSNNKLNNFRRSESFLISKQFYTITDVTSICKNNLIN